MSIYYTLYKKDMIKILRASQS